jgi:hypothetical protein
MRCESNLNLLCWIYTQPHKALQLCPKRYPAIPSRSKSFSEFNRLLATVYFGILVVTGFLPPHAASLDSIYTDFDIVRQGFLYAQRFLHIEFLPIIRHLLIPLQFT